MTQPRTFRLMHKLARQNAAEYVGRVAPDGWTVRVSPPAKRRAQEERYHAMIGDIASQWQFAGQKWHLEDMKRLLIDAFAEAMRQAGTPLHHDGRVVPSLDGRRVVQLGIQSREFYVAEANQFIEYLFAFGADIGIAWSDEARAPERAEA